MNIVCIVHSLKIDISNWVKNIHYTKTPAPIEERLCLIAEFTNENEETIREPLSKAQEKDSKLNPIWCNKYETKGIKHFEIFKNIFRLHTIPT